MYLDYKAIPPDGAINYDKLSKAVSGFADSAGGLLILGVAEDKSVPNRIYPGEITWGPTNVTRETLEHRLDARLAPRVQLLRIIPVRNHETGKSVFLIDVPQSESPPHMAIPYHAYYKRLNFETVPMEHYEVADLFGRRRKPSLHFGYRIRELSVVNGAREFTLDLFIYNTGAAPAKNAQLLVALPTHVALRNEYGLQRIDDFYGGEKAVAGEVPPPKVVHHNQAFRVGWVDVRIEENSFPVDLKYSLIAEDFQEKLDGLLMRIEDLDLVSEQLKVDAPPGTPTRLSIRTI